MPRALYTATPYQVQVHLRVCTCRGPTDLLGRYKRYPRAVECASGYWNVHLAFFGHLFNIMFFDVVDARDGTVLWRNGRHTEQGRLHAKEGTLHSGLAG